MNPRSERTLPSEVEGGLEDRGLEAVRTLIVTAGPAAGAAVHGLMVRGASTWISRTDAEFWVERKDAERAAALKQKEAAAAWRDTIRFWVMLALTAGGAIAAGVAAWEGWPRG